MFKLTIATDNAAFENMTLSATATILRDVAARLDNGEYAGKIHDTNGNTCGTFSLTGRV